MTYTNGRSELRPLQRMQLDLGRNRFDLIAAEIVDLRDDLMGALKVADHSETRDIHVRLAQLREEINDLLAVCSERGSA